jgi:hypothetical protein
VEELTNTLEEKQTETNRLKKIMKTMKENLKEMENKVEEVEAKAADSRSALEEWRSIEENKIEKREKKLKEMSERVRADNLKSREWMTKKLTEEKERRVEAEQAAADRQTDLEYLEAQRFFEMRKQAAELRRSLRLQHHDELVDQRQSQPVKLHGRGASSRGQQRRQQNRPRTGG